MSPPPSVSPTHLCGLEGIDLPLTEFRRSEVETGVPGEYRVAAFDLALVRLQYQHFFTGLLAHTCPDIIQELCDIAGVFGQLEGPRRVSIGEAQASPCLCVEGHLRERLESNDTGGSVALCQQTVEKLECLGVALVPQVIHLLADLTGQTMTRAGAVW